jgi:hypothetical protein
MMNNNHKNPGCGFGEQLVAYLYDEAGDAETTAFETHLETCRACADELEAFSGVHFSIADWKLKEFDALATPIIEIPYEKPARSVETAGVTGSWLSALWRDFFSFSPRAWSLATASFAVLAICLSVVWFSTKFQTPGLVSQGNAKKQTPTPPNNANNPAQINGNANVSAPVEPNRPPNIVQKPAQPDVVVSNDPQPKNNRAVKASNNQRPVQKNENPKNGDAQRRKNNNDPQPKIVTGDDDEEDDTLRLAEIFDEIDTED